MLDDHEIEIRDCRMRGQRCELRGTASAVAFAQRLANDATIAKLVGSAVHGRPWNFVELFEVATTANALMRLENVTPALSTSTPAMGRTAKRKSKPHIPTRSDSVRNARRDRRTNRTALKAISVF